jgi:hypothetical protein
MGPKKFISVFTRACHWTLCPVLRPCITFYNRLIFMVTVHNFKTIYWTALMFSPPQEFSWYWRWQTLHQEGEVSSSIQVPQKIVNCLEYLCPCISLMGHEKGTHHKSRNKNSLIYWVCRVFAWTQQFIIYPKIFECLFMLPYACNDALDKLILIKLGILSH